MNRKARRWELLEKRIQGGFSLLAAGTMFLGGSQANAMPQGGQVVAGAAEIAQKNAEMAIKQMSQNAVVNWQSFNIAAGERVNILQPNAQAAILNRVMDGNITRIMGALQANGRVFIVNPAGILFAPGAQVDVGSLVASSLNISNADFMAGRYAFVSQKDGGKVINKGELIAKNQGLVALLGEQVENDGVIVAQKGTAALAAGKEVTLDFNGDGKVEVVPEKAALANVVDNKGLVEADGGLVFMTAAAGDALTNSVVNQSGIIKAQSIGDTTGEVRLTGGNVRVERGSRIDVSGKKGGIADIIATNRTDFHGEIDAHGKTQGGQVETSGQTLNLDGEVNVAAENGKNGSWLLDPGNISIKKTTAGDNAVEVTGSGYTGSNSESSISVDSVNAALDRGGDVTIATSDTPNNDASITVEDAITKKTAADSTLTLQATGSVNIKKDIVSNSGKMNVNIVADTNHTAGGSVDIADGVNIKTQGGDFTIRGGLEDKYANSMDATHAGVQLGTATITTAGGNIAIAGSTSTQNDGVKIVGTALDAGNGRVEMTGKSNGGQGISLSDTVRITGNDITLTADKAALQGSFIAAGDDSRLGFATLTAGKAISLGDSGDIALSADKFADTDFAKIVLGNDNGHVAIKGASLGTDLEVRAKGGKASVTDSLQAAGKTVTIGADSIEATGAITADRLLLDGEKADVKLTNKTNAIGMVAGKVKSIELTNSKSLQIGETSTEALGLDVAGDPAKITALSGDISLQGAGLTTNGEGKVELTAKNGAIKIDADGADLAAKGKAALDLQANSVSLGAKNKIALSGGDLSLKTDGLELADGGKVTTAGGKVMIDRLTTGAAMSVGTAGEDGVLTIADTKFIDTAGGEIALGSKDTGAVRVGNIETQAPMTVTSGEEIAFAGGKVSGAGKDSNITFAAPKVKFTGDTTFDDKDGVLNFTSDAFSGWDKTAFTDTADKGVVQIQRQTSGDLTVGGSASWLNNDALAKLAAGNFYNTVIGSTEHSGKLIVGNIDTLPHYTSMLTAGGIELQGTVTAKDTDTLVLHGNGLTEANPLTVGKLLLWGNGDMRLDSQVNGLTTIAADMGNGSLELKNGKSMTVDAIYNRNTEQEVAGLDTSKMEITVTTGEIIAAKEVKSKGETKLVADGLELGDWVKTGSTLTLERYDKTQDIKLGSENGAWNVNGFSYKELIINAPVETGENASGHVAIKDTTFNGKTTINAGKDVEIAGQKNTAEDLTINAHSAKLPGKEDALSVTNLTLNLDGGLDLGAGTITGAPEGSLTIGGFEDGQDIYISDTYIGDGYKISYATLNNGLVGFKGLDVSTKGQVHFDNGSLTKSVQVEGQKGVAVEGNLTIAGDKTQVAVKGQKFMIAAEKSLTINGEEANVTVVADDSVALGDKAQLQVAGNNAQLSFTGKNKVALADGAAITINGEGADVAVNGQELYLGKKAKIDLGTSATGNFALQADKVTAEADNTTNITGKGNLALRPLTAGSALTLNNDEFQGAGLHITSDQLNGTLFDSGFTSLTLGDAKTGDVLIDGVTSNNSITVQNASDKTLTIGNGGLSVGENRKVTLQTGAIANEGKMTVGTGSTLNIYTNNMDKLQAVGDAAAVTGTGTLGLGTYDGTKSIALGDSAAGDLKLTNDKFANVFGQDFSHYSIGSAKQQVINVAGANLGKDTTITGTNVAFAGDMDMATDKVLTINAAGKATQSDGRIKAAKLALLGGDFSLTNANEIGTAAAKAKSINLSSKTLTVGEVATPAGAPTAAQTVEGITAATGDITLSVDSLNLEKGLSGQGILNLQPLTASRDLTVGGDSKAASSLNLHSDIFGGNLVKDGFKHVYIGREDSTGTVTVSGDLNFVDPTTIRMAGKQGQVVVKENAKVQTNGNDFTITTEKLTTEPNSQISTGKGAYTIQADSVDLQGTTYGESSLNIMPYDLSRNINLGGSYTADSLWLNSAWFHGEGKLFYGYYDINIGNADGTGHLRTGSVDFDAYVHMIQAINNQSIGEITVSGDINTHGKDYTVSSRQVTFEDAHINADGTEKNGDITIEADNITNLNNSSTIKGHGNLTIGTYSVDKAITLGSAGVSGNGLTLSEDLFSGEGLLRTNDDGLGFASITIGGAKAGDISVGNITIPKNLSTKVKLETTKNITSSGALNVDTLDIAAHSVELKGNNKIEHIGDVTSEGSIEITTAGGMDIAGKIETKTGSVKLNLQNNESGDVTISENGQIVTAGKTPVYIYNENGYFKNKAQNKAITTPDSRYVIYTKDSVENEVGNLAFDFRRYGTDMDKVPELTDDYSGSGFAYQYQPTITIVSTRPYGAENSAFLGTESGYHIVEGDTNSKRHELDQDGIAAVYNARKDSSSYAFETTKTSGANADITRHVQVKDGDDVVEVQHRAGGESYGSVAEDGTPIAMDSGRSIRYTGANPLNYKVETKFYIVPKEVTVTGRKETREYDGTAYHVDGLAGVNISGLVNDETLETAGVTGGIVYSPIADDNQTSGFAQGAIHAGSYTLGIQDSNLQADNYKFIYQDGSFTITPRTLHLSAPSGTRVYGESNEQVDTTASVTGTLANGDNLESYAVTAKDAAGNAVDERTGVGEYAMQVEGVRLAEGSRGLSSDYVIESAPGTLTITPRSLTITANDDVKTYDGTAYVNGNGVHFDGFVAGDDESVLTGRVSYGGSSQWAIHAGNYVISIGDSNYANPNYEISYQDGSLTITPRELTISASDATKVYGEENPQFAAAITTGELAKGDSLQPYSLTAETQAGDDVDARTGTGNYAVKVKDVQLSVSSRGNEADYRITIVDGNLAITPRPLQIKANDDAKVYDGTAYSGGNGVSFAGFAAGDDESVLEGGAIYGGISQGAIHAGSYAISIGNSNYANPNYEISYQDGSLTITPRELTISANDATKVYGEENPQFAAVITAGELAEGDSLLPYSLMAETQAGKAVDARTGTGNYAVKVKGVQLSASSRGNDADYRITTVDGNLAITPRSLKIKANDEAKVYDGTAYAGGNDVSFDGFIAGDDESILTGDVVYGGTSQGAVHVGDYVISIGKSTYANANYNILYEDGRLKINPRKLMVKADDQTKVYGNENPLFTATANADGLVAGDRLNAYNVKAVEADGKEVDTHTGKGKYAIKVENLHLGEGSIGKDSDYEIQTEDGVLTVTPRPLQIKAKDDAKTYDGTAYTGGNGVTISGFAAGDDESVLNGEVVYGGTSQGALHADDYVISIGDSTYANANYAISYEAGKLEINPRKLMVKADDQTKVYGNENPLFTANPVDGGLIANDHLNVYTVKAVDENGKEVDAHTGRGSYAIKVENLHLGEGSIGKDSDYEIQTEDGVLTVTPRLLQIKAKDDAKTYDGTAYTGGNDVRFSGFAAGDDESVLTGGVVYGGTSQGAVHAGDYAIHIGDSTYASDNYIIRYQAGELTVIPQKVIIAAQEAVKIYGEENPQFTTVVADGTLAEGDKLEAEISTPAQVDSNVGGYAINLDNVRITGRAKDGDYEIERLAGRMTIIPREVRITAGNAERNYGEENPIVKEYKLDRGKTGMGYGLLPGDDITGIHMYYDSDVTPNSAQGLHRGVIHAADDWQFNGRSRDNYIFRYQPGDLTIKVGGLLPNSPEQVAVNISTQVTPLESSEQTTAVPHSGNLTVPHELVVPENTVENKPQVNPAVTSGLADSTETVTVRTGNGEAAHDFVTAADGSFGFVLGGGNESKANATTGGSESGSSVGDNAARGNTADGNTVSGNNVGSNNETTSAGNAETNSSNMAETQNSGNTNEQQEQSPAGENEQGESGRSENLGAIPVLYTDGTERELDGIYTINYNSDKLAIMPAAQKVTIPEPNEIRKETAKDFSLIMNSRDGSYNVAFGNGIVSIQPEDAAGLAVVQGDHKGSRTVIATGILSAVQDLGVVPDQIRAVYIYTLKNN